MAEGEGRREKGREGRREQKERQGRREGIRKEGEGEGEGRGEGRKGEESCVTQIFLRRYNTCPMTDQSTDTIKVQLMNQWVLLKLLIGAETTQRKLHQSPPQHK
jgi:hypothetical protein